MFSVVMVCIKCGDEAAFLLGGPDGAKETQDAPLLIDTHIDEECFCGDCEVNAVKMRFYCRSCDNVAVLVKNYRK